MDIKQKEVTITKKEKNLLACVKHLKKLIKDGVPYLVDYDSAIEITGLDEDTFKEMCENGSILRFEYKSEIVYLRSSLVFC